MSEKSKLLDEWGGGRKVKTYNSKNWQDVCNKHSVYNYILENK
jgi:hypothetical protein